MHYSFIPGVRGVVNPRTVFFCPYNTDTAASRGYALWWLSVCLTVKSACPAPSLPCCCFAFVFSALPIGAPELMRACFALRCRGFACDQVKECASRLVRLAKGSGITVFIVGHVTKSGSIAGPKVVEHMVDTVLYLEGDRFNSYRYRLTVLLRCLLLLSSVEHGIGVSHSVQVFRWDFFAGQGFIVTCWPFMRVIR